VLLEGLGKFKNSTSSGIRTGGLPASSIVPQPTTLPRAPIKVKIIIIMIIILIVIIIMIIIII
jgi:hypothetical protein